MATRAKTARTWPNGLGWDVGAAEVRDCVSFFRAFVPTTPEDKRPRHKRMDFPKSGLPGLFGPDPVQMVQQCQQKGTIHYDW